MIEVREGDGAPAVAVETCPVCASLRVHAVEPDWFAIELARASDLRSESAGFEVEFACRDCGSRWG